MEVFAVLGLLALIILNYYSNNSGSIQLVTIGAFMAAAYKIIPGFVKILNSIGQIKTYGYTITDLMHTENTPAETNQDAVSPIRTLAMQHVSFMHKEKEVINDFSLEISKGDFIGLTGISGMGKTTVVNLLLGFLDPDSGKILINNKDTTANDRKQFRKNIAYVKQDPFIIHDTIATNITLNGSNYDTSKMETIIRATGLNAFTGQYAHGLNSIISENGKNISGGQRQRIAVARALYKNAELIILDEPFNELDRAAENTLLEHCKELAAAGKIIVLITHNTESLAYCSKIISMNEN
jgi:ABC-type bacteriocin/lantibiotic exporter with double-glycine peptidase domain